MTQPALPVASPEHSEDATFALAVWVGVLGGAALALDPDPNVTPPANNRIIRYTANRGGMTAPGNIGAVRGICVDGTSAQVQVWFFDNTQNRWVKYGVASILIAAAGNTGFLGGAFFGLVGAKVFVQLVTNTGGVTLFGYSVI